MGIDIKCVPDSFKSKLSLAVRQVYGNAGLTSEEAQGKYLAGEEKKLQGEVMSYLMVNGIHFDWDRMDKRTSGRRGRSDFRICYRGHWISCECKVERGRISDEQKKDMASVERSGGKTLVCYDLESLRDFLHEVDQEEQVIQRALAAWRDREATHRRMES